MESAEATAKFYTGMLGIDLSGPTAFSKDPAMLKLYGEGDPTGRGEAFSYLKVSMKDVFVKQGEKKPESTSMILALLDKS